MKDKINYYIFLPAAFLLFFLESTFIAQGWNNLFAPNLVLILLFANIFLSSSSDFLYIAFFFGFLFDTFSGSNFGIFTLSFVLAAMFIFPSKIRFLKEESLAKIAALSAGAALLYDTLYLFLAILVFDAGSTDYYSIAPKKILLDMIYAAVLVYPAMQLISKRRE